MEHIHKIGVEIEGGWNIGNVPSASPGSVQTDASVSFSESGVEGREFVSQPTENPMELTTWMRRVYPPHTNSSCGLHVHVSLKNPIDYARILDRRFYNYFTDEMTDWGKVAKIKNKNFFSRLEGNNHFCKKVWQPEKQMAQTTKDSVRYAHWNFCWGIRKTAECRMLPTFRDPNVAIAAVLRVVKSVEDYLSHSPVAVAFSDVVVDSDNTMPRELIDLMQ